jgi:hypothetical protein
MVFVGNIPLRKATTIHVNTTQFSKNWLLHAKCDSVISQETLGFGCRLFQPAPVQRSQPAAIIRTLPFFLLSVN